MGRSQTLLIDHFEFINDTTYVGESNAEFATRTQIAKHKHNKYMHHKTVALALFVRALVRLPMSPCLLINGLFKSCACVRADALRDRANVFFQDCAEVCLFKIAQMQFVRALFGLPI